MESQRAGHDLATKEQQTVYQGSDFSTSLQQLFSVYFYSSHPSECEAVSILFFLSCTRHYSDYTYSLDHFIFTIVL